MGVEGRVGTVPRGDSLDLEEGLEGSARGKLWKRGGPEDIAQAANAAVA